MAGKTRNSMMVQARRKTEELAAKRREREAELQSLATDFHASNLLADAIVEEAERQAAELIAKAKQEAAAAAEVEKATIEKMLATGETRQGVAELLDVSVSYVRSVDVAAAKKKKTAAAGSEESGGVRVDAGHEGSDH